MRDLRDFAASVGPHTSLTSFLAAFLRPSVMDERQFERRLWRQLRLVHRADGSAWGEAVSRDPGDDHFGISVAGTAFFVVGLHPGSSRIARRAPMPVLAFNLHSQFERLRSGDRYERFRDTIRHRDLRLQGTINPMLADHGHISEARQYSGRAVPAGWRAPFPLPSCPFHETETR